MRVALAVRGLARFEGLLYRRGMRHGYSSLAESHNSHLPRVYTGADNARVMAMAALRIVCTSSRHDGLDVRCSG